MVQIPDLVGFPIEEALVALESSGLRAIIVESYGKNTEKTSNARVIRQKTITSHEIQLIISFF